jgi:hypothetical protein
MADRIYPECKKCNEGALVPFHAPDGKNVYYCTNCGIRFSAYIDEPVIDGKQIFLMTARYITDEIVQEEETVESTTELMKTEPEYIDGEADSAIETQLAVEAESIGEYVEDSDGTAEPLVIPPETENAEVTKMEMENSVNNVVNDNVSDAIPLGPTSEGSNSNSISSKERVEESENPAVSKVPEDIEIKNNSETLKTPDMETNTTDENTIVEDTTSGSIETETEEQTSVEDSEIDTEPEISDEHVENNDHFESPLVDNTEIQAETEVPSSDMSDHEKLSLQNSEPDLEAQGALLTEDVKTESITETIQEKKEPENEIQMHEIQENESTTESDTIPTTNMNTDIVDEIINEQNNLTENAFEDNKAVENESLSSDQNENKQDIEENIIDNSEKNQNRLQNLLKEFELPVMKPPQENKIEIQTPEDKVDNIEVYKKLIQKYKTHDENLEDKEDESKPPIE